MLEKLNCYVKRLSILLITVALIAGTAGCTLPFQNLEIQTWNDLDAIRDNLRGNHILMNDLDSTTAGYEELASPTANKGKGWQPIGTEDDLFTGTFDGQGYEIRDLFIYRPDESDVGLFGVVDEGGVIENAGVVNGNVTGYDDVGGLVGWNRGTMSTSYSTGSVTGDSSVGGLAGKNNGTASTSYSTGSVTGYVNVGGMVGENTGTVSNSYSTGSVTGDEHVGGLVGQNLYGVVSDSFWDTQTSGQDTSDGGTGKTTEGMMDITTFTEAGWDITVVDPGETNPTYIWNIVDTVTYPFQSWQSVV